MKKWIPRSINFYGRAEKETTNTVAHYNKTIGSLESNFLPQARKINTLSQAYVKKQTLPETPPIELAVRPVVTIPPAADTPAPDTGPLNPDPSQLPGAATPGSIS